MNKNSETIVLINTFIKKSHWHSNHDKILFPGLVSWVLMATWNECIPPTHTPPTQQSNVHQVMIHQMLLQTKRAKLMVSDEWVWSLEWWCPPSMLVTLIAFYLEPISCLLSLTPITEHVCHDAMVLWGSHGNHLLLCLCVQLLLMCINWNTWNIRVKV